jgi:putative oxidoreductase
MNIAKKVGAWGDRHHPKILDLMRIVLGAFLLAKGLIFLNNSGYLRYLILESGAIKGSPEMISAILYYVTYMHVLGGGLIIVGLFTRLWSVLQLPIVFGAVFFVNITAPYINSELWLSILVLALLIVFAIFGSGPLSLDRLLMNSRNND